MPKKRPCIERLVEIGAGGKSEVGTRGSITRTAELMHTYRQVIVNWQRNGYIPAGWALRVEEHTGGKITARDVLEEYSEHNPTVRVRVERSYATSPAE